MKKRAFWKFFTFSLKIKKSYFETTSDSKILNLWDWEAFLM
jgi:hypothetical protein